MEISYYLADPTGNVTILVDSDVPEHDRAEIASKLMEAEPLAEQVGFLGKGTGEADIALSMAGGEFCGNASLSAAAVFCRKCKKDGGMVRVKASGADDPVEVFIRPQQNGEYTGTVRMPLPEEIQNICLEYAGEKGNFSVVRFKGISHLICIGKMEKSFAEKAAEKWCADLGADALGIMQIDLEEKTLLPLVYVRKAGTLFWESSCASGTAAAGAYLHCLSGESVRMEFSEPAGKLGVEAGKNLLNLTGKVKFLKVPAST